MNNTFRIHVGHWLEVAKNIPDNSVHVAITSPPYYGLRAYNSPPQIWMPSEFGYPIGGCQGEHEWEPIKQYKDSWRRGERSVGFFSDTKRFEEFTIGAGDGSAPKLVSIGAGPVITAEVANRTRSRQELSDGRWTCTNICARCGAWKGELGQEPDPAMFVDHLVQCFAEVHRILRPDGLLFVNLGDAYYNYRPGKHDDARAQGFNRERDGFARDIPSFTPKRAMQLEGYKQKDLMDLPWEFAIAMRRWGWYRRSTIVWCLSGGTHVYARTENRDITVTTINALYNARPRGTQLWNGEKWTDLLGLSRTKRTGTEVEIVLRSGERVCATPNHQFPTTRGLLKVEDMRIGDRLMRSKLPEPEQPRDCVIDNDAAWLAGLYLAEGSKAEDTIQIAGHVNESERWERCCLIARKFGGYITRTIDGNNMSIRMYGRLLNAILDELIVGGTAHTKALSANCWRYSNKFLTALLDGYLHGDGHWDEANKRWRLGFCRNYNIERDLRCLCARLGHTLTLNPTWSTCKDKSFPSFRGEIRTARTGHYNERDRNQIVCLRKARSRYMYDLGVADTPNVFALASGLMTHNSKPNPLSESVDDRPTQSWEPIFMFSKSETYYYDKWAVSELPTGNAHPRSRVITVNDVEVAILSDSSKPLSSESRNNDSYRNATQGTLTPGGRNRRNVWTGEDFWTINVAGYADRHYAAFAERVPELCLRAGSSEVGCCPECAAPWKRIVLKAAKPLHKAETLESRYRRSAVEFGIKDIDKCLTGDSITLGWKMTCRCKYVTPVPCTVLDPFAGRGTTGAVAVRFGRNAELCDLTDNYVPMIRKNLMAEAPLWVKEIK